MALIGSITPNPQALLNRVNDLGRTDAPTGPVKLPGISIAAPGDTKPVGFSSVFENLIYEVDARQDKAQAITRDVLLGKTDQVHQSVVAMQEAGVAFQLMVEVRNKVVESYQELMRMPV